MMASEHPPNAGQTEEEVQQEKEDREREKREEEAERENAPDEEDDMGPLLSPVVVQVNRHGMEPSASEISVSEPMETPESEMDA
ncbi:hypothetical protein KIPB_016558, partial [Kipferlia bialata]|eukprot:g16558.t1